MQRAEIVWLLGAILCILIVGLFVGQAHAPRPWNLRVRRRHNMIVFFIVMAAMLAARLFLFGL